MEGSVNPFGAGGDCLAAMAAEILAIGGRLIRCDGWDPPAERAAEILSTQWRLGGGTSEAAERGDSLSFLYRMEGGSPSSQESGKKTREKIYFLLESRH